MAYLDTLTIDQGRTAAQPPAIDLPSLSKLISRIYSCAMPPETWESLIQMICESGNFCSAIMKLQDRTGQRILIQQADGASASSTQRFRSSSAPYGSEMGGMGSICPDAQQNAAPRLWSRDLRLEACADTPLFKEWLRPQGIAHVMHLPILRQADRSAEIYFGRTRRKGPFTEGDIALASLLQPHLRQALTLSNKLESQTLRTKNLRSAIGKLSTGVLLLAGDGGVLEVNPAAERLLGQRPLAFVFDGRPDSGDQGKARLLRLSLIPQAEGNVRLATNRASRENADEGTVNAFIMPLGGDQRSGRHQTAVAVMLLTPGDSQHAELPKAEILGIVYGLTSAEKRVAEALADGKTSLQAAKLLGLSEATIRSHTTRIFVKTGVTRQTGLIALMHRLAPPPCVHDWT